MERRSRDSSSIIVLILFNLSQPGIHPVQLHEDAVHYFGEMSDIDMSQFWSYITY